MSNLRIKSISHPSSLTPQIELSASAVTLENNSISTFYYGPDEPTTTLGGFIWYDTNTSPPIAKFWDSDEEEFVTFTDVPITATGGNEIVTIGSTKYHVFTSSSNFVISSNPSNRPVEILVVGGGGGGGRAQAGGGGAGAIEGSGFFQNQTLNAGSYTVTIGAQGNGSTNNVNKGGSGGQSQFVGSATITALGGGGGGSEDAAQRNGLPGGSGGGARGLGTGGSASGSNTNAGGTGSTSGSQGAGGGGGATAVGSNGTSSAGGNGGQGKTMTEIDANLTSGNFTSFASMTRFSSGGGGGALSNTGGTGGTGAGNGGVGVAGGNAVSFGSGGGGGGGSPDSNGGNGKGGVVIVKYAV
jgi:hypothetical protein